jgi:hypothetical protein
MPDTDDAKDLLWFVSHCIDKHHRHRWRHILLERPDKAAFEMHKFEKRHSTSKCVKIDRSELENRTLSANWQHVKGTYFNGRSAPQSLSLVEVFNLSAPFQEDSLFCSSSAEFACFFHHDGPIWEYRK